MEESLDPHSKLDQQKRDTYILFVLVVSARLSTSAASKSLSPPSDTHSSSVAKLELRHKLVRRRDPPVCPPGYWLSRATHLRAADLRPEEPVVTWPIIYFELFITVSSGIATNRSSWQRWWWRYLPQYVRSFFKQPLASNMQIMQRAGWQTNSKPAG